MEATENVIHSPEMIEIMGRTPMRIYVLAAAAITSAIGIILVIVFLIKIDQKTNFPCKIIANGSQVTVIAEFNMKNDKKTFDHPKKVSLSGIDRNGRLHVVNLPLTQIEYQIVSLKNADSIYIHADNIYQLKNFTANQILEIVTEKNFVTRLLRH